MRSLRRNLGAARKFDLRSLRRAPSRGRPIDDAFGLHAHRPRARQLRMRVTRQRLRLHPLQWTALATDSLVALFDGAPDG